MSHHWFPGAIDVRPACRPGLACLAVLTLFSASAVAGKAPIDTTLPPMARVQMERSLESGTPAAAPPAASGPAQFEPAPLPNQDLIIPRGNEAPSGPVIGAGLFRQTQGYRGDGYVKGSTATQSEQPKRLPLPGILLKVPLN